MLEGEAPGEPFERKGDAGRVTVERASRLFISRTGILPVSNLNQQARCLSNDMNGDTRSTY